MNEFVWVFGYGSLVSPASLARTIERTVVRDVDAHLADLHGFGRRWNYGSVHVVGDWSLDGGRTVTAGTVVALGLVESGDERTNGVVVRVSAAELAALDDRERNYDRIDVTRAVTIARPLEHPVVRPRGQSVGQPMEPPVQEPIMTYVPRANSIERYESARAAGTAAIRRSYWDLVDDAFVGLGGDQAHRYRASTPTPDIPVVDIVDVRQRSGRDPGHRN